MHPEKAEKVIFAVFAIVGAVMIVASIIFGIKGFREKNSSVEIEAVIDRIDVWYDSDGDERHDVYVSYDYNGHHYSGVESNYYNSGMREGKVTKIHIDPDRPYEVSYSSGLIVAMIALLFMGLVFFLVGAIPTAIRIKKEKNHKRLLTDGRRIIAKIEDMYLDHTLTVNGYNPFVILCKYTDDFTGVEQTYKSHHIWDGAVGVLEPGMEIQVYVDRDDPKKYFVDPYSALNSMSHYPEY